MTVLDLTATADEELLLADFQGAVRSVAPGGRVTDLAGGSSAHTLPGREGSSDPRPGALAALPDGGFLVSTEASLHAGNESFGLRSTANPLVHRVAADGGFAVAAGVHAVELAALPDGGFLAVDEVGNQVARVAADGAVTVLAGTGDRGFAGDGGPAALAKLSHPSGVAVPPDGSVLIADQYNDRIRRVDPSGIITTIAEVREPRTA